MLVILEFDPYINESTNLEWTAASYPSIFYPRIMREIQAY